MDDGSESRGHRANIFKKDFQVISSYTGKHSEYEQVTVVNYAAGFLEKGAEDPI